MENHYRGWSPLRAKIHSNPSIPKLPVQTSCGQSRRLYTEKARCSKTGNAALSQRGSTLWRRCANSTAAKLQPSFLLMFQSYLFCPQCALIVTFCFLEFSLLLPLPLLPQSWPPFLQAGQPGLTARLAVWETTDLFHRLQVNTWSCQLYLWLHVNGRELHKE